MPDHRYFINEWFNVVECANCGLGFVNPRPTRSEMSKYYPSAFFDYFESERDYHLRRYSAEAKFLQGIAPKGHRRLLDLGCANGDFPRYMQQLGWKVEGVEVSQNSKTITDFKVYKQDFTEIEVYEPSYDAITAWAVLEHVHDPMAYFKKVALVLKSGGVFVFLVTNFKSLSSRCLFLEDIPRHLYFFTEETVKKYLATSGFDLIHTDYDNKIYSMRPINFLRYYFYRYFKKQRFEWRHTQFRSLYSFEKNHLTGKLKHLLLDPIDVFDQLLSPIYERYQIITKKYGIVTYIAMRR
ncbi:MAG: class I SAM-dependent methyltransferase [Syntrophaceae bacterium]|nr:class I SAM-dependent methyltransferase [Syntrophaceae bacterium]